MNYRTLVKIHGYIAVFFLPMAILYAVTGAFYIVGESGSVRSTSIEFPLAPGWPQTFPDAREVADHHLQQRQLRLVPRNVDRRVQEDDEYYWRGLTHSVTMTRSGDATATVIVNENDLYRQLVEIHKNHAGVVYAVIGFAFGIAMAILIVSGSLMMFRSRLYRRAATWLLSSGTVLCIVAYYIAVRA